MNRIFGHLNFVKINSAQGLQFSKVFFDFHLDNLAKCKVLATFTWPKTGWWSIDHLLLSLGWNSSQLQL